MDLREGVGVAARAARRRKSHFHPWKSFIGKKATAEATAYAEQRALAHAPEVPIVRKLTVGLIDTYEAINAAYYEKRQRAAQEAAAAAAAADEHAVSDALAAAALDPSPVTEATPAPAAAPASAPPPSTGKQALDCESDHSAAPTHTQQATSAYCDENFDYIVRAGDLFNNRYVLEKVIGRGSFGQVVRAYDRETCEHVAVKIIKANGLYATQAQSEVRMTCYLNRIDPLDEHAIMRIRDRFVYRGHQCLVLELLSFSLYDLLRSTEFYGVSLNLVRKFARQILGCLAFLARRDVRIAHCDLKPENVLLRHPQRSAIKVVDFGASARVSDCMFTYVQSRFYRAPEVILGLPYDTQVDVWSLGCMLVELHTGYPLFAGRDEGDQIAIIVERCGIPPRHMLELGKKTSLFFDRTQNGWKLKDGIARREGEVIPGSKPVRDFVHELTANTGGKRRRPDASSDPEYNSFLVLCEQMLALDPRARTDADAALRTPFFIGVAIGGGAATSTGTSSPLHAKNPASSGSMTGIGSGALGGGRKAESPQCLPELNHGVSESVPELQPGRNAPVQQTARRGVSFHVDDAHSDCGGDHTEPARDRIGGDLRLSKSETAIPTQQPPNPAPAPYALHASTWAEQVGIDPPPWRAEEAVRGVHVRRRRRRPYAAAGGGFPCRPEPRPSLPRTVEPIFRYLGAGVRPVITPRFATRAATATAATPGTRTVPFPMGTLPSSVAAAARDARARRIAANTGARPPPLRVAGHGDALLLRRDAADERRLALANTQPAPLYF